MLKKIKEFFSDKLGPGSTTYGILKACRRCVYQKSHEPILIFSMHRGPRVIVNLNGKCYVRRGECVGFKNCGKCFEQAIKNDKSLPCKWIEF